MHLRKSRMAKITLLQARVWYYTYVHRTGDGSFLTQEQIGKLLGIKQAEVSRLLSRIRKARPDLISDEEPATNITLPKMLSYVPAMDKDVKRVF